MRAQTGIPLTHHTATAREKILEDTLSKTYLLFHDDAVRRDAQQAASMPDFFFFVINNTAMTTAACQLYCVTGLSFFYYACRLQTLRVLDALSGERADFFHGGCS